MPITEASAAKEQTTPSKASSPAVKLLGEALMPGTSLLMDGQVASGGVHAVIGLAAKALLGPLGLAIVIANSYSTSTTGKNLLKQLKRDAPPEAQK
jgi:hypothetical protein